MTTACSPAEQACKNASRARQAAIAAAANKDPSEAAEAQLAEIHNQVILQQAQFGEGFDGGACAAPASRPTPSPLLSIKYLLLLSAAVKVPWTVVGLIAFLEPGKLAVCTLHVTEVMRAQVPQQSGRNRCRRRWGSRRSRSCSRRPRMHSTASRPAPCACRPRARRPSVLSPAARMGLPFHAWRVSRCAMDRCLLEAERPCLCLHAGSGLEQRPGAVAEAGMRGWRQEQARAAHMTVVTATTPSEKACSRCHVVQVE